ncbi:NAD(+) diphosphatase [Grimontia hollisae]|uniref:NAD(+) diphosphatase n=1 Tax=Grimontia hollisae TaxID=673 RepID=A0A377HKH7_GRIHO|nr:NAD(+) diphosphatase [Grimontia hollisae]MDF2185482.1 NAD(+) diphosphatase [Grimontia hollisae]STO56242.1 NADH pyrophosphatase [Grimontia hollisae]
MSDQKDLVYLCCVTDGKLWQIDHKLPLIPKNQLDKCVEASYVIGCHEGYPVVYADMHHYAIGAEFDGLRSLLHLPATLFNLAGRAIQLDYMRQTQKFCSHCGNLNHFEASHPAMVCPSCDAVHYPKISPCVIVAVKKGDQILLAHHPRHKNGMYTVIAGFVETGETLEQCVAREVKEETGIEVCNIRYFDSQPWAFPSNLMVGFIADYASGDINPDYEELTDARWFSADNLPLVAPKGTIARRLIEACVSAASASR